MGWMGLSWSYYVEDEFLYSFCAFNYELLAFHFLLILINRQPEGFIRPSRGLRQGDPISPYLFVLCAEGFSSIIRKSVSQGVIHPVRASQHGPPIFLFFFADDCPLFARATYTECQAIITLLQNYELESGQVVNYDKFAISFGSTVLDEQRSQI